jgi:hypothetical protein
MRPKAKSVSPVDGIDYCSVSAVETADEWGVNFRLSIPNAWRFFRSHDQQLEASDRVGYTVARSTRHRPRLYTAAAASISQHSDLGKRSAGRGPLFNRKVLAAVEADCTGEGDELD